MKALNPFAGWALYGVSSAAIILGATSGLMWLGKNAALSERDVTTNHAEVICTAAGSYYKSYSPKTGQALPRTQWGGKCREDVTELKRRSDAAAEAEAQALRDNSAENQGKTKIDVVAAVGRTKIVRKIKQKLETLHATPAAQRGEYGPDWYDLLSDALGLQHGPEAAEPTPAEGGGDDRSAGTDLSRPDGLRGPTDAVPGPEESHDGPGGRS